MKPPDLGLYLVTDRSFLGGKTLKTVVEAVIGSGVSIVQLREKNASSREFYELALALKNVLAAHRIPLIINDRLDIALAAGADGLHIGNSDLPYHVARRLLGKDKIIGLSVESHTEALIANDLDVDYIAVSPVFETATKTDTARALGLDGLKTIRQASCHPCIGIGGIHLENAAALIEAGADGIAVVSAIMAADDPASAARALWTEIRRGLDLRSGCR